MTRARSKSLLTQSLRSAHLLISVTPLLLCLSAHASDGSLPPNEVEGAIAAASQSECEGLQETLIQSGVDLAVSNQCFFSAANEFSFLFDVRRDLGLVQGPNAIPTNSCKKLAHALVIAPFNDTDSQFDNAEGYCEPTPQNPNLSHLFVTFDRDLRQEMVMTVRDLATCYAISNALIDSGIDVEIKPIDCWSGSGNNSNSGARARFYTKESMAGKSITAPVAIPSNQCAKLRDSMSAPVLIYPGDMVTAFTAQCLPGAAQNQAFLSLALSPYTGN
jgi:hypothetical protein